MSEDNFQYSTDDIESVMLFVPGKEDAALYSDDFRRLNLNAKNVIQGRVKDAIDWVKKHEVPSVMVVDIDEETSLLTSLSELSSVCGPTCKIVTIGSSGSLDLYRNMLTQGVFDYLVKPITLDRFASVFSSVKKGKIEELPTGRTIAVTGVKGGVGTSLIALGMAQILATERRITTGLVDFDRTNGCLGLLCGMKDDAGLSGVLKSDNIDSRFLHRSMNVISEKLSLLSQAPDYDSSRQGVDQEHVLTLGATLCQMFNQVIWDLPSGQPDGSLDVLACSQTRVLVTDYTVVSARNLMRLLKEIGDESDGQRIIVVSNAHRENSQVISRHEFEQFIDRKVDLELPYAAKAAEQMLLKGALNIPSIPLLNEAISTLVDLACGYRAVSKPKRRFLSRLVLPFERRAS